MQHDTDDLSMSVPLNTLPSPRDYLDSFKQEFELKQQKNGNEILAPDDSGIATLDYDLNPEDLLVELLN